MTTSKIAAAVADTTESTYCGVCRKPITQIEGQVCILQNRRPVHFACATPSGRALFTECVKAVQRGRAVKLTPARLKQ